MKLLSSSPKWRSQFFFVCERSELLASLGIWKRRTKCDEGNGIRTQPSLQDTHKVCCTVYDLTAIVASQPVKFLCNLLSSSCLCLKWWRNVTLEMSFDRQQHWRIKKQLHTHATFFSSIFYSTLFDVIYSVTAFAQRGHQKNCWRMRRFCCSSSSSRHVTKFN